MDDDRQVDITGLMGMAPNRMLDSAMPALETSGRWRLFNRVLQWLSGPAVERLQATVDRVGLATRLVGDA